MRVIGLRQTIAKLAILAGPDLDKMVRAVSMACAQQTRTTAIKSIQTIKGTKRVRRQKQGGGMRWHIVSPPGSPPNTDTGALAGRSIAAERFRKTGARVGTSIKYGKWLERGTTNKKGGVKMAARPWLAPAAEKTDVQAIAMLITQKHIEKVLAR